MEQNKKHKMNKARTTATVIMTIVIIGGTVIHGC